MGGLGDPVVRIDVEASDGAARAGRVHTARGSFATPCFMPVGTRAAVRALSSADLEALGAEVVLANTYHLMLRPGADVVAELGHLHGFMGWDGHVLTDSGGYQVFSLDPKVDDHGATFRSTYDGSTHVLTPEGAVRVQQLLGADIQMVLDVCPSLPSPPEVVRQAVERTAAWAARAVEAHRPSREAGGTQALFGIVQGGVDATLRAESAQRTVALGFDGYGIGGLSVGEPRHELLPALEAALAELPPDRPRYLMGVGDPVGLVEAVARGVDLFDCVLPTRLARHGTILTGAGRLNLRNAVHARDPGPLDPDCTCTVCARWSRAYLRHLLMVQEPSVLRLATLHNVHWILRLVERVRCAIGDGDLARVRAEVAAVYP
ncbi:MAG: tRNA guanosine(34) transglycosylase Tgt [Acidimicrobiales bacterium]|jgi:queuine tRNA-ribosyltransferase|nr:tRNA guanosine(34) transglycosylase Tgt [Acidimicrobiales bacterium]